MKVIRIAIDRLAYPGCFPNEVDIALRPCVEDPQLDGGKEVANDRCKRAKALRTTASLLNRNRSDASESQPVSDTRSTALCRPPLFLIVVCCPSPVKGHS